LEVGVKRVLVLFALGSAILCLTTWARTDLIVAVPDEPPSLDPTVNASAAIDQILQQNVYEGLVQVTPAGAIEPALADSFEISPDGRTYTFFLRKGVVFHDGSPFTADDVVATFLRDMAPGNAHPHPEYYTYVEKIEASDSYTVIFRMSQVDTSFLSLLALGDSVILPEEYPETLALHPIGTGPFRFLGWTMGESLRLERFSDYYLPYEGLIETVVFRFIPDSATAYAALLAGDVDLLAKVPAELAIGVADDQRFVTIAGPQNLVQMMAINKERIPFSDLRVRQAMAHAVDRIAIIDGTMFGYGIPLGSHMTPASPYYVDLTGLYPHDLAVARRLLADAGYPDGFTATLTLPQNYEIHVRTGEILTDQLAQIGINLRIDVIEWGQWLSRVYGQADYDLTVIGHVGKLDPAAMLSDYGPGCEGYYYRRGYRNATLDTLLEEGRRTVDETRRWEIYAQAQEIIARDVVNLFIQDPYQIFIARQGVQGLETYPIYLIDLTHLFWSS
jgi:peptide/nickel transport system substrate-binding protein